MKLILNNFYINIYKNMSLNIKIIINLQNLKILDKFVS
jgi:hypothetical protein